MNLCGLGTLSFPEEQLPYRWLLLTVGAPSSHNPSLCFFPGHSPNSYIPTCFVCNSLLNEKRNVLFAIKLYLSLQNSNIVLGIFWKVCLNKMKKICSGEQVFRRIEERNIFEHGSTLCQVGEEASVPMVVGLCSNSPSLPNVTPDAAV